MIAVEPLFIGRVAATVAFAVFLVLTFVVAICGLLIIGGIVAFALSTIVLGPLARYAFGKPRCPHDGCVVTRRARMELAPPQILRTP